MGELPPSPQALKSPATEAAPALRQIQVQDNGDASDDDQMVICEETNVEIDLKCKEKVTDSDSESQSDLEASTADHRNNHTSASHHRYSPQLNNKPPQGQSGGDVTCRPKPIKALIPVSEPVKYNPAPVSTTFSFHYSPVNPTGVSGFQPTGKCI